MASLTYKLGLNKKAIDYSKQGVDADGDGKADQIDEDGDGVMDELYVPAAPGIGPFVARACKTAAHEAAAAPANHFTFEEWLERESVDPHTASEIF